MPWHPAASSTDLHSHPRDPVRVRTWRLRAGFLVGLTCVILAITAVRALASTGSDPGSAIPQQTLDRMLAGRGAAGKPVAPGVAIPRTPAGAQVAWLLSEVNGGSATLTSSEVRSHVARNVLAVLPADAVVRLLRHATDVYGPLRLTGYSGRSTAGVAIATLTTKAQRRLVIHLRVETGVHARIVDLDIDDRRSS